MASGPAMESPCGDKGVSRILPSISLGSRVRRVARCCERARAPPPRYTRALASVEKGNETKDSWRGLFDSLIEFGLQSSWINNPRDLIYFASKVRLPVELTHFLARERVKRNVNFFSPFEDNVVPSCRNLFACQGKRRWYK